MLPLPMTTPDPNPPEPAAPEFAELSHFEIDPRSVRLLEQPWCEQNQVVVLGKVEPGSDEPVPVGMLDPARRAVLREASARLRRKVRAVRLNAYGSAAPSPSASAKGTRRATA